MNGDPDLDLFTQALRADLPSSSDEARLRLRLTSAGVLASAGVMVPTTTAAATSTAATGVAAKFAALPLAVKLGASIVLAGAAAVPLVRSHVLAPAPAAPRALAPARAPLLPRTTSEVRDGERLPVAAPDAPRAPEPPSTTPGALGPGAAPAGVTPDLDTRARNRATRQALPARGEDDAASSATRAPNVPAATEAPSVPAVAAFPPPASVVDEGTLRAETALMERALAALKQGNFAEARHELSLHASQFPNGHLAPERQRALARIREKETTP